MKIYESVIYYQNFASGAKDGWTELSRRRIVGQGSSDDNRQAAYAAAYAALDEYDPTTLNAPMRLIVNIFDDQRKLKTERRATPPPKVAK